MVHNGIRVGADVRRRREVREARRRNLAANPQVVRQAWQHDHSCGRSAVIAAVQHLDETKSLLAPTLSAHRRRLVQAMLCDTITAAQTARVRGLVAIVTPGGEVGALATGAGMFGEQR